MPHLDGFTLARRLRARGDGVPIIGMSGAPSLRDQYLAAGATNFVGGMDLFEQIVALVRPFAPPRWAASAAERPLAKPVWPREPAAAAG